MPTTPTSREDRYSEADPPETLAAKLAAMEQQLQMQGETLQALREELKALRLQRSPEKNYEVGEAAEIAGISRRKLDELIHAGEVPSMKIGRRRLIPCKAFKAWLRSKVEGGRARG